MIQSDFHLHTCFSGDSNSSVESMIQSAIKKGLKTICFTDHQDFDYHIKENPELSFDLDVIRYFKALQTYKEKYKKQIEILIGIEFGVKKGVENSILQLSQYPFDFILASSHEVRGYDPYYPSYYDTFGIEGIRIYFESIIENISLFDGFQSYGHLDYAIRYLPKTYPTYHPQDYFDLLDIAMRKMIELGKGIECNTGSLKYGLKYPHPHFEILKRYRELGGEILTVGSDAHKPEHIAYGFKQIPDILKAAGFQYYTIFKNQQPIFLKL